MQPSSADAPNASGVATAPAKPRGLTQTFDVFLSYSRKDVEFAAKLEKALRGYSPPRTLPLPQRRLTVFRDQTDMLGVELTRALDNELHRTSKLVVICSPDARMSPYVNHEIESFAERQGAANIIPVLFRGVPNNEARPGEEAESAFPPALVKVLPTPLAAEFRGFRPGKDAIGRHGFEQGWYKLLADVYSDYGITRAQIEQREQRRRARRRAIVTATTATIMAALLALTVWALIERTEAIRQRNDAVSRQLAHESNDLVATSPDTALLLAAAAYGSAPTVEARLSLESSFLARPRLRRFLWGHTADPIAIAFARDGRRLASIGHDDKKLVVWDVGSGAIAFNAVLREDPVVPVAFSPDGQHVFTGERNGAIRLWGSNGTEVRTFGASVNGDALETFALSPDGHRLVTAYNTGKLNVWNVDTGIAIADVDPHQQRVHTLAFSTDGKLVATGSDDGTAAFWDTSAEHHPVLLSGHQGVHDLAWNRDATVLAVAHGTGQVNLWEVPSGRLIAALRSDAPGRESIERERIAFSPDSRTIALAGALTEPITLWDVSTSVQRALSTGSRFGVHAVAFSHAGSRFAAVAGDGTLRFWDTKSWTPIEASNGGIECLAFSPDDTLVATCGHDRVTVWDVNEPDLVATLQSHREPVGALRFSADGTYLASASRDRDVSVWNVRNRQPVATYQVPKAPGDDLEPVTRGRELRVFAFSPDGKTIATGGRGKSFGEGGHRGDLVLWNFAGDGRVVPLAGHPSAIAALAFSPNSRQLAAADGRSVRLWDVLAARTTRVLSEGRGALCLAFDPSGTRLAAGSADDVLLYDLREATPQAKTLRGHERPVRELIFSPDGRTLVSGSFDGTARIWNTTADPTASPPAVARHTGDVNSLALSADGRMLATASRDQTVGLWDARDGALLHRLTGHNSAVVRVAFSPDGRVLASSAENGSVILWDVTSGREMLNLGRAASLVAFSPSAWLLATAGGPQNVVSLWNLTIEAWADRACSVANRNLTCDEWRQYFPDMPYRPICAQLASPTDCREP